MQTAPEAFLLFPAGPRFGGIALGARRLQASQSDPSLFHDAEAARSLDDVSGVDIAMKRRDHSAGTRRGGVVLGEREHYKVAAERVLALAAEREDGVRLHQLTSVETERTIFPASHG